VSTTEFNDRSSQAKASARGLTTLVENKKIDVDKLNLNGQTPSRWNEKNNQSSWLGIDSTQSIIKQGYWIKWQLQWNGCSDLENFELATLDTIQWESWSLRQEERTRLEKIPTDSIINLCRGITVYFGREESQEATGVGLWTTSPHKVEDWWTISSCKALPRPQPMNR